MRLPQLYINCAACHRAIAANAVICPICGVDLRSAFRWRAVRRIGFALVALGLVLVCVWLLRFH